MSACSFAHEPAVFKLNCVGDLFPHAFSFGGFLRSGHEVELQSKLARDICSEHWPRLADIGRDGKTAFEPRKSRHLHAERDAGELCFWQPFIDGALNLGG